jgi:hypothetical protein
MKDRLPRRRITTHVETLHGELCIYEWTTKMVHALNPAAARVWEMCDGSTTVEDMTARIGRDGDMRRAAVIVEHALAAFARADLLEPGSLPQVAPLLSRRALLRRIGVGAAIPVVTSMVAPTPLAAQSGTTRTFNFTGAAQSFDVPAGVTVLHVDLVGGTGGGNVLPFVGGGGGRVQADLPVTPLEVLTIMVGGGGVAAGGFNGGGAGQVYGGGGASDIRRGAVKLAIAGGGGGVGNPVGGPGGAGGGLVGQAGASTVCGSGAGGGTQSAGGAGGSGTFAAGSPGVSGTGGAGATGGLTGGSGGGGGYFGGGGSGSCTDISFGGPGGGGGGSSFTDASATSVVHTQGFGGSPRIILSW